MFYGAKTSGLIILLFVCLIPAAATLLAILAGIYACFPSQRRFSLVLAYGCLIIYAVIVAWFLLTGAHYHSFAQFLDAIPAGRFFRTFIPFVAASAIVYFDLHALKKDRRKGEHKERDTKIPEIRKPESDPEPKKMNPIGKLPPIRK